MGEGDILSFMGDFNSRLKRCDGKRTGMYTPHKRADDGGVRMLEIMYEYDLLAGNTIFKLTRRKAARDTGSAAYCISKAYVQPKHKLYVSGTIPPRLDRLRAHANKIP